MQEILEQLDAKRAAARLGGGERRIKAQHERGKLTARERIELLLDPGLVRRDGHVRRASLRRFRHGRAAGAGRRRGDRPRHRSTAGWSSSSARTSPCSAARCPRRMRRRSARSWTGRCRSARPVIGINDSGGARIQEGVASLAAYAEVFMRNVWPAAWSRRSASSWALRRRCGLLAGDDRLHLHGPRQLLHVRDRPGGGAHRHQRGGDPGGAGRGRRPTPHAPASPTSPSTTTSRPCTRSAASSTSCR